MAKDKKDAEPQETAEQKAKRELAAAKKKLQPTKYEPGKAPWN